MDHPAIASAQQQSSQFRSSAVAPNVASIGNTRRMAAFARKPVQTGMAGFANVRQEPYAPSNKVASTHPQALQQLLTAYLYHTGMHG